MKKALLIVTIGLLGISLLGGAAEAKSKTSLVEAKVSHRKKQIEAKLEKIRQKTEEKVKNKVAEKIKAKEEKIAKEKAVAEAKRADEKKAVEQKQATTPVQKTDANAGASQSGYERGQRNREYGQQLSDPNLSQAERQQIIQEKKDYNRGQR